jgi:hypothetical protein
MAVPSVNQLLADKAVSKQITEAIKKCERDVLKEVTWRA